MKYLSLFSGVGGFERGIELAIEKINNRGIEQAYESIQKLCTEDKGQPEGAQTRNSEGQHKQLPKQRVEGLSCIGFSEIDKYATAIYKHHFPNHHNYGDITKIDPKTLPDFDLLVGGFPCQAFSIAGKRRGFDDTRGTLFFEIARIAKEKQPRLLLLENVKGLLSHDKGRTFYTIITTLDELGYDCEWQVLNSKNHGVPQNRERVFIIGHLRGTHRPEVFPFGGADGEVIGIKQINSPTHSNDRVYDPDGISPTLNTMQGGRRQPFVRIPEATKKGYAEATVGQSINLAVPNSKTRRGRVSDLAQTLDTGMQQYTLTEDARIRRITPIECERLQGFPDNWTKYGIDRDKALSDQGGYLTKESIWNVPVLKYIKRKIYHTDPVVVISDSQRYKCCGNAVTVNVIRDIVERLLGVK